MSRIRKLSPKRRNQIQELISEYQPETVVYAQNMLKDLLGDTLQQFLELELEDELGCSK